MTYYSARDGNMESHDGVVRLSMMRILSNRPYYLGERKLSGLQLLTNLPGK